ncbi:MAG: CpsD/CapB family tyrosine-protein kinase [Desulfobacterales bacterium]|nr:CpsD/CapB family tyrosine-protein kinase [Desulfobacterales bacterium]
MGHESSQSYYLKQFLKGQKDLSDGSQDQAGQNFRESFLAAAKAKEAPAPEVESAPPHEDDFVAVASEQVSQENTESAIPDSAPSVPKDRFLWDTNIKRFPEDELPFLSQTSIKQLESNFRELMIVEANILALEEKAGNTIYVSSCSDKAGKTIAAVSTAYALSFYSGKNVLLIDGNHHNPQIHSLFGVSEGPGFYDVCQGKATLEDAILPTLHKGLSILTIGDKDLAGIRQESVSNLLGQLSQYFDHVVCDGGSVMTSSLTLRDIVHYSAALLVIECEKTRWEVLQIAGDKIKKSGGPTAIGVVFNRRKYYIPRWVYKIIS